MTLLEGVTPEGTTKAIRVNSEGRSLNPVVSLISTGPTQTASLGTDWTALAAGACSQITLQNVTGATISYRLGEAATEFDLPTNSSVLLPCLANSSEWQIRRKDTSNTRVTVQFLRVG
ncbi:hypothetical protein [Synechococcus sp. PCC 6312]|uniref:hypothetical protein n=1 Tax=Synechococcus sp. (strain ATCC 27167 / PCC 6312) TaxID=195253 RepID=UPI00029ED475|nr:hypothetical protein [Synechococcus sp. PCC 6312]AFY60350.1 hypothetical protein Syn6312_1164 [Synechococcus sp. PCC 6312]